MILAIGFVTIACSMGEVTSGPAVDEVTKALNEELAAEKSGNADAYLAHVTDKWLKMMGYTREKVKADPSLFQSDDPITIEQVRVRGDKASVDITGIEGGLDYQPYVNVVKQDGTWKLDEIHIKSPASIPSGAKTAKMDLADFSFAFNPKDITSQQVTVLRLDNKGKQPHMVGLLKLPANADFQALLRSDQEMPGVEFIGVAYLLNAGEKADVVVKEKLSSGRYAFVCYVPDLDDPESTPHAFKGMATDFKVD